MTYLKCFIIIYILYLLCNPSLQKKLKSRIIGGEKCNYPDYPYAVAIYSRMICGGSILAGKWVLTAAHCIIPSHIPNKKTKLRTGFQYTRAVIQERYAIKGISHEKYSLAAAENEWNPELRYDIGLILVDRPFEESSSVKYAVLPTPGFTATCNESTALGIGETGSTQAPLVADRALYCVDLPIVDAKKCQESWQTSVIDDSIVCTLYEEGGKDACFGDSGGPLVCKGVVIGVISAGKGCALPDNSAIYTSVESYLEFINTTMEKNSSQTIVASFLCLIAAGLLTWR